MPVRFPLYNGLFPVALQGVRSIGGINLSSVLTRNMHAGAEDLRILLTTDVTNNFLAASWQASLDALSYSIVGLWDSIMRELAIFG